MNELNSFIVHFTFYLPVIFKTFFLTTFQTESFETQIANLKKEIKSLRADLTANVKEIISGDIHNYYQSITKLKNAFNHEIKSLRSEIVSNDKDIAAILQGDMRIAICRRQDLLMKAITY